MVVIILVSVVSLRFKCNRSKDSEGILPGMICHSLIKSYQFPHGSGNSYMFFKKQGGFEAKREHGFSSSECGGTVSLEAQPDPFAQGTVPTLLQLKVQISRESHGV